MFNAEVVVDELSQGSIGLAIGAGLSVYGTAVYGTGTYGSAGRRKAYTELPETAEGRTVWLKTTYTGQEAFKQFTYAFGLMPETAISALSE